MNIVYSKLKTRISYHKIAAVANIIRIADNSQYFG